MGRHGLSPAEVAFLAESTMIAIQPRQAMSSLQLLDVRHYFQSNQEILIANIN